MRDGARLGETRDRMKIFTWRTGEELKVQAR
jgi:hypothetical protein